MLARVHLQGSQGTPRTLWQPHDLSQSTELDNKVNVRGCGADPGCGAIARHQRAHFEREQIGPIVGLIMPLLYRGARQTSIDLHQMRSRNFVIFFAAFVGHSRLHDRGVAGGA